jgi:hypothetical protein
MWKKVFEHLGHETYWFDDENHPADFDYDDAIFITEGYADAKIPIRKSSIYFVHIARDPSRYLSTGARLIDIRYNVDYINDVNYSYVFDRAAAEKVEECAYYIEKADDSVLSNQYRKGVSGYSALYLSWATDLLPHEFNFEDRFMQRSKEFYFVGSIGEGNMEQLKRLNAALVQMGIPFRHVDPWRNPVSFEDGMKMVQMSYIAPDIRGSALRREVNGKPDTGCDHKHNGYIPCRVFKNISYGQLGATNSKAVRELMGGLVVHSDDEFALAFECQRRSADHDFILEQMKLVQDKHTYVNRARAILKVAGETK